MNIACLDLAKKHSAWERERFTMGRCDLWVPKPSLGNAGIIPLLDSGTAQIWGTFGCALSFRGYAKLLRACIIPVEQEWCAYPVQGHKKDHQGGLLVSRSCLGCWPQQGLGTSWSSLRKLCKKENPRVAEIFNSLWSVPLPWLFLLAQSFLWKRPFVIKSGGGGQMLVQVSFIICQ